MNLYMLLVGVIIDRAGTCSHGYCRWWLSIDVSFRKGPYVFDFTPLHYNMA